MNAIVRTFTVATAQSVSLVFDHAGGDNGGLVLDNLRLTRVPEPSAVGLMACVALGAGARCRP